MNARAAAEVAAERVAAARDDPTERLRLAAANIECGRPSARGRFARSELAFLRSQISRGVLAPHDSPRPGSAWWRAVNERLLRDALESTLLVAGAGGRPSTGSVELWLEFAARPSSASWYRAHNASVVADYLEHEQLAARELLVERFFLNVALVRVLYAHALVAAPRLAVGRLAPLGRWLGNPRGGTVGFFLSIRRVFPDFYPLAGLEGADGLISEGVPAYVWPAELREQWLEASTRRIPRLLARLTGADELLTRAPSRNRPRPRGSCRRRR